MLEQFWNITPEQTLQAIRSDRHGLTEEEAKARLALYGLNTFKPRKRTDQMTLLIGQFNSPIVLILLFAAILAFFLGERTDSLIILIIVFASGLLGFWQEKGASDAVKKLQSIVEIKAMVERQGEPKEIPVEEIVPGDIVILNAGDIIPGDALLIEESDLFVDEAALTGETFPAEKSLGEVPAEAPVNQRTNSLFLGTHVVSGNARALIIATGKATEFGKVYERLTLRPPETDFEHGVRRFGYLLLEVTLVLIITIFAANVFLNKPIIDSFLFSLALAVGLTPQLLPAIISINLARGARRMAEDKVIVKRLASIENFGSMEILCTDKTGTLTEGSIKIESAVDLDGKDSSATLLYACLNSHFESGFTDPIDAAINSSCRADLTGYEKAGELPYDFIRKRISVLVKKAGRLEMATKGALVNLLNICSTVENADGKVSELASFKDGILKRFNEFSQKGFRVLGVCRKDLTGEEVTRDQESGMTFLGFLIFSDPIKPEINQTFGRLKHLGITLKMITGDNRLVAEHVMQQAGKKKPVVVTASALRQMSDEALARSAKTIDVFAEVDPNQKERIILALRKAGKVVGYMGDGINDASALHAADVGISVESAVDVAKESADFVLLEKDLEVLINGVQEGRRTFANTLKYVFMATSANFGNMFSMAGASLFLPFLPLLPKQILLNNLMTDFPEMTIATDAVDKELIEKPRRWNVKFIRNFMIVFGLLSSIFDYLTFGALFFILHAGTDQFRTGWFVESVISAAAVVLVIRTRKPFFKSMPSKSLAVTTLLVAIAAVLLPYTPLAEPFGFAPLQPLYLFILGLIVAAYILLAEISKSWFYRFNK